MTRMLTLAALALACVLSSPAFAADVVAAAPVKAVALSWEDWVVAIGQPFTSVLLPVLVALLGKAVYQIAPWAHPFLTQARLEQMTKAITDHALNATEAVMKGPASPSRPVRPSSPKPCNGPKMRPERRRRAHVPHTAPSGQCHSRE